jgi:hypothetical protein
MNSYIFQILNGIRPVLSLRETILPWASADFLRWVAKLTILLNKKQQKVDIFLKKHTIYYVARPMGAFPAVAYEIY